MQSMRTLHGAQCLPWSQFHTKESKVFFVKGLTFFVSYKLPTNVTDNAAIIYTAFMFKYSNVY